MSDNWKITGSYFESCNCAAACPCVFLSSPTTGECTALVGWHINDGSFGAVDIGGLNVALAVYSPGNMVEVQWQVALYVDDKADEQQQGALAQIFSGQAGGHFSVVGQHIGEVLGMSVVPIDFKNNGKTQSMKVGNVATVETELIEGQGGAEVTVSNHPLAISPGFPVSVGHSKELTYHDHGMDWELAGTNSYQSPFDYAGP
ncbi:MAG: DUF1326 domain-containing protein [Chloroflexi bacterium]|jgi:hypothetical protein|nr:DUF1326 domain-containing protein [Chloroflexota bacterium]MBT5628598.1 DUF1326 domain-containing protein [Chloroflexota bacterium]